MQIYVRIEYIHRCFDELALVETEQMSCSGRSHKRAFNEIIGQNGLLMNKRKNVVGDDEVRFYSLCFSLDDGSSSRSQVTDVLILITLPATNQYQDGSGWHSTSSEVFSEFCSRNS